MSNNRVLPIPTALSDRGLAQRWNAGPDSFERARIMTERRSSTAYIHSPQASTSSLQAGSLPVGARRSISPEESIERKHSPTTPHPTPTPRKRGDVLREQADILQEEEGPASICLCQPDPKVPRPRNAFILYRQHHQALVVKDNPGVSNPQISKVIGDLWRAEPEEKKNHWRLLAEEEKARHQKQYPGYRYQPRKSNRTNSVSSTLAVTDEANLSLTRCAKCGGRNINSAAIMSVTQAGSPQNNHAHRSSTTMGWSPSHSLVTPSTSSGTSRLVRGLASPPTTQVLAQGYGYLPYSSKPFPLKSPHPKRLDTHELAQRSPDAKRRRMTNSVAFVPVRGPTGPLSPLPFSKNNQHRESLPRLDSLGPSSLHSPFTMGPPQRQHPPNRPENPLTLAPLQQATNDPASNTADTQAKSLEAMILSIPILNKIKVLARISAPLAASPPSSPTAPTTATASTASAAASREQTGKRGLVIAVDAADPAARRQLTTALAHALEDHDVKVIATPRPAKNAESSFQSYLRLIDEYHTLSARIKEHITTPAAAPSAIVSPHQNRRRAPTAEGRANGSESPVSPKSFPKTTPPKAASNIQEAEAEMGYDEEENSDVHNGMHGDGRRGSDTSESDRSEAFSATVTSPTTTTTTTPTRLPIAILPAWQLTHTDAFACSVDITDRYSPIDHWQWGATVWRGVVGADITVAVKADVGDDSPVKSDPARSAGGRVGLGEGENQRPGTAGGKLSGVSAGRDIGNAAAGAGLASASASGGLGGGGVGGGVEVRLVDSRAVVVKGEAEGGIAEGHLRRVGFEVGEWVRNWADVEAGRRRTPQGKRGLG